MENFVNKVKKVPFGIITGACAMIVFFATAGLIIAYIVTSGIAEQTTDTVSFVEEWWQMLFFIADIIAAVIAVVTFVMYILKKIYVDKEDNTGEVCDGGQA